MDTSLRVLMVEDSEDDALLIVREMRRGGYDISFTRVDSAEAMQRQLDLGHWDLVVCDYSMPHFSGDDALRLLRSTGSEAPFIFVSGTIGEDTAVAALKQGAQDYVMKGNLKRLLPAVRRELIEVKQREERFQLERELQRLQRFESFGRLAGGIAHDFNNALGVIAGWAQMGSERVGDPASVKEIFQKIESQARSSAGLTRQLLAFARRQVLQPRNIDLNELVSETINLLHSVIASNVEVRVSLAKDKPIVRADSSQIEQVVMNLCINARDAMPNGGKLVVETRVVEITEEYCRLHSQSRPGTYAAILVMDTGTGMDAATLEHIFEPFFTTKEPGHGTGLGLATVYGVVKQHEGFVTVETKIGEGTTFGIHLPLVQGPADRPQTSQPAGRQDGNETILVAEDHDGLREFVREVLERRGYHVLFARNGEEAVQIFSEHSKDIALVFLDVVMPKKNGIEAYHEIVKTKPDVPVIFTTGHTAESLLLDAATRERAAFLEKPYRLEAVGRIVREQIDRARKRTQ